jgi:hypothetical protein
VWLDKFGQLKNPIESATFRLVALAPQPTTLPPATTRNMHDIKNHNLWFRGSLEYLTAVQEI